MRNNYYYPKVSRMQAGKNYRLMIMAFLFLMIGFASQAQSLYLNKTTGDQTIHSLEDIRSLEFSNGNVVINKTDQSILMIPANTIRYASFREISTVLADTKITGQKLKIFPNPVAERLNLTVSGEISEAGTIELLSIEGKVLHTENLIPLRRDYRIDVSHLSTGLYLCKVQMGEIMEVLKFWKN